MKDPIYERINARCEKGKADLDKIYKVLDQYCTHCLKLLDKRTIKKGWTLCGLCREKGSNAGTRNGYGR